MPMPIPPHTMLRTRHTPHTHPRPTRLQPARPVLRQPRRTPLLRMPPTPDRRSLLPPRQTPPMGHPMLFIVRGADGHRRRRRPLLGGTRMNEIRTVTHGTPRKSVSRGLPSQKTGSLVHCNGCVNTWTGSSACHCSGCHRTFTGITAFDIHRAGGYCTSPEEVLTEKGVPRLVRVQKAHWSGWGHPGERPEEAYQ